jgi:outer membrane protein assembly factor BamA
LQALSKIKYIILFVVISSSLVNCSSSKYIGDHQFLLSKNILIENGEKKNIKELSALIKQQPNKKILGVIPLYLIVYNLSKEGKDNNYFKRIGEPPVLLNHRLARKSSTQIELYYKNRGYLDAIANYNVKKHKNKARVIYSIMSGKKYKLNKIKVSPTKNKNIELLIDDVLKNSKIQKGNSYNFKELEEERVRISDRIQNKGFYQFNKEFIYFLADTNQLNHTVDLNVMVKNVETEELGTILKQPHKIGVIEEINIYLDYQDSLPTNTLKFEGVIYTYHGDKQTFNLNRISEKMLLKKGMHYNKNLVTKVYESLSELKNFKKIDIQFKELNSTNKTSNLSADFYLKTGKKIAYSIEAEATSNPTLNEGVSIAASISHYNIFKGSEHLQLTYKGSNNFNNINENGMALNLTIPSLISPIKFKRVMNKNYRTSTVLSLVVSKQERPEFTRNTITGNFGYQWKTNLSQQHKFSPFTISYVNFEGDSTDLSQISEYLIAKNYSNHLIPSSSYTFSFSNLNLTKLKNHTFFKFYIESSGSILNALAKPLNFNKLKDDTGTDILQNNGKPSYTLKLWNNENIFTQYIKTSLDYRYYWEIDKKNNIALRVMGGVAYAFGNTNQVPFHKKFSAGGPNDLRGWRAYKRPTGMQLASDTLYTGGLKLLTSLEYRFNVINKLKGAVFMDAGNIWELEVNNAIHEAANFNWADFTSEIAIDVGFGLRYDFQYFILRTDIGFPVREPNLGTQMQWDKLNFKDSQLNIGLGYPF